MKGPPSGREALPVSLTGQPHRIGTWFYIHAPARLSEAERNALPNEPAQRL